MLKSSLILVPKEDGERRGHRIYSSTCHFTSHPNTTGRWRKDWPPPPVPAQHTHTPCSLNMGRCQHSKMEISQALSHLLQIFQALLQPRPQEGRSKSTLNSSKWNVPCWQWRKWDLRSLGGLLLGTGYLSHFPLGHWAPSSAVLVNNQVSLPAESSCPSRSHSRSLQVKLFHFNNNFFK